MELSLADQQGQLRWFETIKSPLRNEPETVTGTVGIARDITDRKHAEYLLRAQRDLGAGLSTTSDVTTALKHLLEIALQIGGVDCGGIYLPDETNGGVELVEHRGVSAAFAQAVAHYAAGSPQMSLLQQGQSFFGSVGDLPSPVEASRLREGLRAIALVPLRHEGKLLGALTLASHTAAGIPAPARIIIEALAAQAAGALTRIRAETERHRLERQLLEITDREQARIGQDIHDGLCQHLVILAFDANSLHGELSAAGRPEVRKAAKIAAFLDEAITEARQLSRGLFPVRLEKEGLPPALEELARTTHRRFKVRCQFRCRGSIRLQDGTVATHLYRIAQEAVTNAVKHSHARSLFISLAAHAGQIELKVEDDGSGFSPKASPGQGGMGLHIMDYRARSIGGTVRLTPRPQGGTVVLCCVRGQFE
jgi:signal transduction histidine kinase